MGAEALVLLWIAGIVLAQAPAGPTPPAPDNPPGTAILCLGRPSMLGADVTIEVAGKSIGTLSAGKYARAFLPTVRTTVRVVGPTDGHDSVFQLVAGERKYLRIGTKGPGAKAELDVEEVSVEDNGFAKSCSAAPVLFGGS